MFDRNLQRIRLAGISLLLLLPMNSMAVLDDPTRPPGHRLVIPGGGKTAPSWYVNTIKIGEQQRSAVINGRRVRIGDKIDGARVIDIQPSYVRLRYQKEEIAVRLVRGSIRKRMR